MIVGGGPTAGTDIVERFVELGGGTEDGGFVIVPTGKGNRKSDGSLIEYLSAGWKPTIGALQHQRMGKVTTRRLAT